MKRIAITKDINSKWLTKELLIAGVNVAGVGVDELGIYAEIAEADEITALTVIEAHNPEATPDILERTDLESLEADITNQVDWIGVTIPEIDNGLAAVGAFTNATQRAIVTGLLQNQRRTLLIIRGILKAFRFVIRRLR